MCSEVIQPAARRVAENSPPPAVNNFAAEVSKKSFSQSLRPGKIVPGRIALWATVRQAEADVMLNPAF
jgi:hypothetical protein